MPIFGDNRTALKIARRSVKRNRLQSVLVVLIMALPLMVSGFFLTYKASTTATPQEIQHYQLGESVAIYQVQLRPHQNLAQTPTEFTVLPIVESQSIDATGEKVDIHEALPNTNLLPVSETVVEFKTATGVGTIAVTIGEVWNDHLIDKGPFKLVSGRTPKSRLEAMVSRGAIGRFGIEIGEEISTTTGIDLVVVGIIRDLSKSELTDIVYVNDSALPEANSDASEPVYYQLDGKAPTWAEVLMLNKQGIAVISSAVLEDLPPYTEQPVHPQARGTSALVNLSLILILLLIPVLVLSSSAFAFGARRQTRTLAVMASLGATRGTLLKVNLASGVWLGLLAGGVGTSFGVLASFIVSPHIAKGNWTSWSSLPAWVNYPGFHVPWDQLILLAAASILIGVWASLLPALRASKVNILATLRGTRTESEIRVRNGVGALIWLLAGVGGIVVAVSLISAARLGFDRLDSNRQTLIYIGGLLALLSGFATLTGFIVGSGWVMRAIATVTARMGKTANYAGRDLIFNRSRYAPVLSSVLVVYFLGTLLLGFGFGPTYSTWSTAQKQLPLMPGQYISIQPLLGIENVQGRSDVTLEELLKYQPSSQRAESESRLIFNTGAFTDVTVINSTVDLAGLAPRSPEDGSWLPQLNTPSPVIEFNPNNICYHSALSPKSPEFWAAHSDQNEVTPADLNQPPGCLNALEPNRTMVVGGADDLRAILRKTDPVAEQVLASGGVVLFSRLYDFGGKSRLTWVSPQDYSWEGNYTTKNSTHTEQLTSYLVPDIASESFYFTAMISEEAASKFGIEAFPTNILANANGPISIEVSDQLQGSNVFLDSFPNQNLNPHIFAWVIVALAGLFSLSAISIALGLSQIEAKADKRTLAALGAPKPFRSGMVATQAFTLAIMGAVLGGITGIAVGVSVVNAITPAFAMVPWVQLFTLVVLIPVLAAFGFWVFSPRKLKFENRLALD